MRLQSLISVILVQEQMGAEKGNNKIVGNSIAWFSVPAEICLI